MIYMCVIVMGTVPPLIHVNANNQVGVVPTVRPVFASMVPHLVLRMVFVMTKTVHVSAIQTGQRTIAQKLFVMDYTRMHRMCATDMVIVWDQMIATVTIIDIQEINAMLLVATTLKVFHQTSVVVTTELAWQWIHANVEQM